jgi:hypothetical protein
VAEAFLLLLVVLTSVGAYAIGRRALGLSVPTLGRALRQTLEVIGLTVVFFVANLGIGLAIVLGLRALTTRFVSVYVLDDASLVALSALQAIVVSCWWGSAPGSGDTDARPRSL